MNKKTLTALVCLSIVFTLTLFKLSPITKNGNTLGVFDSGVFDYSTSKRCIQMGGYCSSTCPPNTPTESYKCYFGYFIGCSIRQRCVVPIGQPKLIIPIKTTPTSVSYKPTPTAIDVGNTNILPPPPTPITESSGFVSCQTIASLQAKYCGNTPTRSPQPTTTPAQTGEKCTEVGDKRCLQVSSTLAQEQKCSNGYWINGPTCEKCNSDKSACQSTTPTSVPITYFPKTPTIAPSRPTSTSDITKYIQPPYQPYD